MRAAALPMPGWTQGNCSGSRVTWGGCGGGPAPAGAPELRRLTTHKFWLMVSGMNAAVAENRIFQSPADPSRRAIFESLTRGEAAVKDFTARFDISQPAVSQHLAALKDAV